MAAAAGASIRAANTANLFDGRITIRQRQISDTRHRYRLDFPDYRVTTHEYGGGREGGEQRAQCFAPIVLATTYFRRGHLITAGFNLTRDRIGCSWNSRLKDGV
jgi:hypothetical protein